MGDLQFKKKKQLFGIFSFGDMGGGINSLFPVYSHNFIYISKYKLLIGFFLLLICLNAQYLQTKKKSSHYLYNLVRYWAGNLRQLRPLFFTPPYFHEII